jgi:hypothetical protein
MSFPSCWSGVNDNMNGIDDDMCDIRVNRCWEIYLTRLSW